MQMPVLKFVFKNVGDRGHYDNEIFTSTTYEKDFADV